jgi:hypothetical protein
MKLVATAALSALLLSCASDNALKAQAVNDLKCPKEQVTVTQIDDGRMRAEGCGRSLGYMCEPETWGRPHCVPERVTAIAMAQKRAAAEFGCRPEDVVAEPDGDGAFLVSGCGQKARYGCKEHGSSFVCVRKQPGEKLDGDAGRRDRNGSSERRYEPSAPLIPST